MKKMSVLEQMELMERTRIENRKKVVKSVVKTSILTLLTPIMISLFTTFVIALVQIGICIIGG